MDLLGGISSSTFHPNIKPYYYKRIQFLPSSIKPSTTNKSSEIPTMSDIIATSRSQNLEIRLQKLGPLFRVTAMNIENQIEIGRAEGIVRVWIGGKILHLDSVKLRRESLEMEKSIFGISLFIGAVAIRHGYDCGCKKAELLAINDSDEFHSKLVRFYTRMGFKVVREVTGSSMGDVAHMLAWGGVGTRMDADVTSLLLKWSSRFIKSKSQKS